MLKCHWGITVPLLHDLAYKGPKYCGKHCLPDVVQLHSYLLVRVGQVEL